MLSSPLVFISFALGQLNCYKWPTAVKGIISPRPSIRKKVDFRPAVQKGKKSLYNYVKLKVKINTNNSRNIFQI